MKKKCRHAGLGAAENGRVANSDERAVKFRAESSNFVRLAECEAFCARKGIDKSVISENSKDESWPKAAAAENSRASDDRMVLESLARSVRFLESLVQSPFAGGLENSYGAGLEERIASPGMLAHMDTLEHSQRTFFAVGKENGFFLSSQEASEGMKDSDRGQKQNLHCSPTSTVIQELDSIITAAPELPRLPRKCPRRAHSALQSPFWIELGREPRSASCDREMRVRGDTCIHGNWGENSKRGSCQRQTEANRKSTEPACILQGLALESDVEASKEIDTSPLDSKGVVRSDGGVRPSFEPRMSMHDICAPIVAIAADSWLALREETETSKSPSVKSRSRCAPETDEEELEENARGAKSAQRELLAGISSVTFSESILKSSNDFRQSLREDEGDRLAAENGLELAEGTSRILHDNLDEQIDVSLDVRKKSHQRPFMEAPEKVLLFSLSPRLAAEKIQELQDEIDRSIPDDDDNLRIETPAAIAVSLNISDQTEEERDRASVGMGATDCVAGRSFARDASLEKYAASEEVKASVTIRWAGNDVTGASSSGLEVPNECVRGRPSGGIKTEGNLMETRIASAVCIEISTEVEREKGEKSAVEVKSSGVVNPMPSTETILAQEVDETVNRALFESDGLFVAQTLPNNYVSLHDTMEIGLKSGQRGCKSVEEDIEDSMGEQVLQGKKNSSSDKVALQSPKNASSGMEVLHGKYVSCEEKVLQEDENASFEKDVMQEIDKCVYQRDAKGLVRVEAQVSDVYKDCDEDWIGSITERLECNTKQTFEKKDQTERWQTFTSAEHARGTQEQNHKMVDQADCLKSFDGANLVRRHVEQTLDQGHPVGFQNASTDVELRARNKLGVDGKDDHVAVHGGAAGGMCVTGNHFQQKQNIVGVATRHNSSQLASSLHEKQSSVNIAEQYDFARPVQGTKCEGAAFRSNHLRGVRVSLQAWTNLVLFNVDLRRKGESIARKIISEIAWGSFLHWQSATAQRVKYRKEADSPRDQGQTEVTLNHNRGSGTRNEKEGLARNQRIKMKTLWQQLQQARIRAFPHPDSSSATINSTPEGRHEERCYSTDQIWYPVQSTPDWRTQMHDSAPLAMKGSGDVLSSLKGEMTRNQEINSDLSPAAKEDKGMANTCEWIMIEELTNYAREYPDVKGDGGGSGSIPGWIARANLTSPDAFACKRRSNQSRNQMLPQCIDVQSIVSEAESDDVCNIFEMRSNEQRGHEERSNITERAQNAMQAQAMLGGHEAYSTALSLSDSFMPGPERDTDTPAKRESLDILWRTGMPDARVRKDTSSLTSSACPLSVPLGDTEGRDLEESDTSSLTSSAAWQLGDTEGRDLEVSDCRRGMQDSRDYTGAGSSEESRSPRSRDSVSSLDCLPDWRAWKGLNRLKDSGRSLGAHQLRRLPDLQTNQDSDSLHDGRRSQAAARGTSSLLTSSGWCADGGESCAWSPPDWHLGSLYAFPAGHRKSNSFSVFDVPLWRSCGSGCYLDGLPDHPLAGHDSEIRDTHTSHFSGADVRSECRSCVERRADLEYAVDFLRGRVVEFEQELELKRHFARDDICAGGEGRIVGRAPRQAVDREPLPREREFVAGVEVDTLLDMSSTVNDTGRLLPEKEVAAGQRDPALRREGSDFIEDDLSLRRRDKLLWERDFVRTETSMGRTAHQDKLNVQEELDPAEQKIENVSCEAGEERSSSQEDLDRAKRRIESVECAAKQGKLKAQEIFECAKGRIEDVQYTSDGRFFVLRHEIDQAAVSAGLKDDGLRSELEFFDVETDSPVAMLENTGFEGQYLRPALQLMGEGKLGRAGHVKSECELAREREELASTRRVSVGTQESLPQETEAHASTRSQLEGIRYTLPYVGEASMNTRHELEGILAREGEVHVSTRRELEAIQDTLAREREAHVSTLHELEGIFKREKAAHVSTRRELEGMQEKLARKRHAHVITRHELEDTLAREGDLHVSTRRELEGIQEMSTRESEARVSTRCQFAQIAARETKAYAGGLTGGSKVYAGATCESEKVNDCLFAECEDVQTECERESREHARVHSEIENLYGGESQGVRSQVLNVKSHMETERDAHASRLRELEVLLSRGQDQDEIVSRSAAMQRHVVDLFESERAAHDRTKEVLKVVLTKMKSTYDKLRSEGAENRRIQKDLQNVLAEIVRADEELEEERRAHGDTKRALARVQDEHVRTLQRVEREQAVHAGTQEEMGQMQDSTDRFCLGQYGGAVDSKGVSQTNMDAEAMPAGGIEFGGGWMEIVMAREEAARFRAERDDARERMAKIARVNMLLSKDKEREREESIKGMQRQCVISANV